MEQSTRVGLPSGGWWELKGVLSHGDKRWIEQQAAKEAMRQIADMETAGINLSDALTRAAADKKPDEQRPNAATEDAVLRRCSVAWSFQEAISPDAIMSRDERDVRAVLDAVMPLYGMTGAEQAKKREGKSPSGAASNSPR